MYKVSAKSERVTWGIYEKFVRLARNDPDSKNSLERVIVVKLLNIRNAAEVNQFFFVFFSQKKAKKKAILKLRLLGRRPF